MKISDNGLKLIQNFEGLYLKAYKDRVGVWTIGWGTTNCDRSITGTTIKRGLTISRSTAEKWLRKSLDTKYGPKVSKYDSTYHWTQNEYDALVSFAYNLGHIDQLTDNGKRSRAQICEAWLKYDKAGGKHVKGLQERRQAELKLFRKLSPSPETKGNPYPEPIATVASNETATQLKLQKWIPQGEAVKWVQWELVRLGYEIGQVDGIMGRRTTAAVVEFQSAVGLTADGAVGAKTRAELVKAKEKPTKKKTQHINYRERAAKAGMEVYPLCIGRKHGKGVQNRVKNLEEFKKQKELNCHLMLSLAFQEAGLLPEGCFITHTPKGGTKKKITDAVKGTNKLKHCKVYWVNRRWKDLPEEWKQPGVGYIQDSNACMMSTEDSKILSCNKSVGKEYKDKEDYLRESGYVKTSNILVVLVPDE